MNDFYSQGIRIHGHGGVAAWDVFGKVQPGMASMTAMEKSEATQEGT